VHELALAEGIVATALKEAERAGLKVTEICVRMGELQQIDEELFKSVLRDIIKVEDERVREAEVVFLKEEAVLRCRVCGHEWTFGESRGNLSEEDVELIHFVPEMAHIYIGCPECGSPDFEITKGRGIWIEYIKGERWTPGSP